ncbi:hypothetical protein AAA799B03_00962 [Marine Group I thaumarchaeote SCGC AAA799-B03]|uniref:Uncharacterized protein n=1 Tax=Marine Group I thaumarchaeote SCGC AAA799-B03 TaxID=1502289 RepID=A0A087S6Y7_9ARCH|nr:hypothetical protein AAA799B03_00962 [Marine Group I thaumarchaeote SCGC AAA799-B03]
MTYLAIGVPLFFVTIIFGSLLLTERCDFCDNQTIQNQQYIMIVNFGIWILSIVLIVIGLRTRAKNRHKKIKKDEEEKLEQEKIQWKLKQEQDNEIQELKDKVKKLEEEKKDE